MVINWLCIGYLKSTFDHGYSRNYFASTVHRWTVNKGLPNIFHFKQNYIGFSSFKDDILNTPGLTATNRD